MQTLNLLGTLGVLLKNEIKHKDMIRIMEHYQQYIPTNSDKVDHHDPDNGDNIKLYFEFPLHIICW